MLQTAFGPDYLVAGPIDIDLNPSYALTNS
jgi:hypothetical protein